MPKYQVIIPNSVAKKSKRINPQDKIVIKNCLRELETDPYPKRVKKLKSESIGIFRIRVGDYRIRYDISQNFIIIRRIAHRREAYRKLK